MGKGVNREKCKNCKWLKYDTDHDDYYCLVSTTIAACPEGEICKKFEKWYSQYIQKQKEE